MQIELLEVGRASKKDKYFILPIKYKDLGNGKEFDRKIYSFNSDAYKVLKGASVGDIYSVDLKKDDNGYWQWENVEKDDVVADAPKKSTTEAKVGTVRSTYETPEERAKRQLYITRQWAVNAAIEFLKMGEVTQSASLEGVLDVAKKLEAHVQRVSSLDFTDDKPWENDENGN